jgi:hypothetical protein
MGIYIRQLITKLHAMGMITKYLCCGNAGEHLKESMALCDKFAMTLKLTAPDMPHRNMAWQSTGL